MENLNKENFFDAITAKYPRAMEHFHEWINSYKASVDWDIMFNAGAEINRSYGASTSVTGKTTAPKFDQIPYEMQFGILIKFVAEVIDNADVTDQVVHVDEMRELLEGCFAELQGKLKPSVTDLQERDMNNIARHGESQNDI